MVLQMFSRIARCYFREINRTFMQPTKTSSGSLWFYEEKSLYRDDHSWQSTETCRNVFWGAVATFSVVLAVQKRRAFCTNDPIKEKLGAPCCVRIPGQLALPLGNKAKRKKPLRVVT